MCATEIQTLHDTGGSEFTLTSAPLRPSATRGNVSSTLFQSSSVVVLDFHHPHGLFWVLCHAICNTDCMGRSSSLLFAAVTSLAMITVAQSWHHKHIFTTRGALGRPVFTGYCRLVHMPAFCRTRSKNAPRRALSVLSLCTRHALPTNSFSVQQSTRGSSDGIWVFW